MKGEHTYRGLKLLLLILFSPFLLNAQTINDAKEAFNNGVTANSSNNLEEAIKQFNQVISICNNLQGNEDAESLLTQTEGLLPKLNLQLAKEYFQNKSYDKAAKQFQTTKKVATTYNDAATAKEATDAIPQVYSQMGIDYYKKGDFKNAVTQFSNAASANPQFAAAYYYLALTYSKLDNSDKVKESADKALQITKASNDSKLGKRVTDVAATYFLEKANKAKGSAKYEDAVKYINQSLTYDDSNATAYYLLAAVQNSLSHWDEAIEAANKALKYEVDNNVKKAKDYFELGNAYKGKQEYAAACDAFKKASYGAFEQSAKYQIKYVLKCGE